jgi:hypothetical protein
MNTVTHKVLSPKGATLKKGTYDECTTFARDWAIAKSKSPRIVTVRSLQERKVQSAGRKARQLVMQGVFEGSDLVAAIETLNKSGLYDRYNVLRMANANQALTPKQVAWLIGEAAKLNKAHQVGLQAA